jgi:hypothetical protein
LLAFTGFCNLICATGHGAIYQRRPSHDQRSEEVNPELDRLFDELLKGKTLKQILGENVLINRLTRRMAECVLTAEFTAHLGYEPTSGAIRRA